MIELGILTVGLTQVFKMLGCPTNFLPLVAVIIGAVTGYVFGGQTLEAVGIGMMTGLAATGLVNQIKDDIIPNS